MPMMMMCCTPHRGAFAFAKADGDRSVPSNGRALGWASPSRRGSSTPSPCFESLGSVNALKLPMQITARREGVLSRSFLRNFFGSNDDASPPDAEADIVPSSELPFPVELLDDTFLRGRDLAMAFRASEDGFDALTFHEKVDLKGPCMIYAETEDGIRFGGFNSEGFSSSDDYAASFKAFLYCWPKGSETPVVLNKVGGPEAAVFDYARGGPQWGAEGLVIGPPMAPVMGGFSGPDGGVDGAGSLRVAKCRLGQAYEMIPEQYGQRSIFGGTMVEARIREVEVYYAPELAKLYRQ